MATKRPLTSGDIAQVFGVSIGTVANWVKDGKLRAFTTPGGHRRFRPEDVDAFIAEFDAAPTPKAVGE